MPIGSAELPDCCYLGTIVSQPAGSAIMRKMTSTPHAMTLCTNVRNRFPSLGNQLNLRIHPMTMSMNINVKSMCLKDKYRIRAASRNPDRELVGEIDH